MKQLLLLYCCLWGVITNTHAQQLAPTVLSSGGSSKTAGGLLLEDHVGGIAVTTITTGTFMYTQGFLQPNAGTTSGPLYVNDVTLSSGSGIDNAGTTFVNGGLMLEFTIGEMASRSLSSGSNLLTQGILQPYPTNSTLPVSGLEFTARRINATTVQLDWKTIQEMNNKGFYIERRQDNETAFSVRSFENSKAGFGGNSQSPLAYQYLDQNNSQGSSYYRLKQEDHDGSSSYSVIRLVKGDPDKLLRLQVWPVPAIGWFNVSVSGLGKPDQLLIFDVSGRLVKQLTVSNDVQQQVTGLSAGTYFIRLAGDQQVVQKLIVQ